MGLINVDLINVDQIKEVLDGRSAVRHRGAMEATSQHLTASEAAARLGVKRASLYAYVSRGLLDRSVALDGRTSLFDPRQVDALRSNRRRTARGELSTVISSSVTRLDESGHEYRDRPVSELVEEGLSFEAVSDLIWERDHRREDWVLAPELVSNLGDAQRVLTSDMPAIDRCRISVSVASGNDPLRSAQSSAAFVEAGRTMILAMAVGLLPASIPEAAVSLATVPSATSAGVANTMWRGLTQGSRKTGARRNEQRVRALEMAMIMLADHGLATSTFGVRLSASVRADPYSVVATGLGSMGGILHGSASVAVSRLLERAQDIGPAAAVGERFSNGDRLPGFGHTIYRKIDPREAPLLAALEAGWGNDRRLETLLAVRALVSERIEQPANVDFPLGAMAWLGHFDDRATSIFAVARTAGWIAHAIEEMSERPVRFRPAARYVPNHADPNQTDLP